MLTDQNANKQKQRAVRGIAEYVRGQETPLLVQVRREPETSVGLRHAVGEDERRHEEDQDRDEIADVLVCHQGGFRNRTGQQKGQGVVVNLLPDQRRRVHQGHEDEDDLEEQGDHEDLEEPDVENRDAGGGQRERQDEGHGREEGGRDHAPRRQEVA